MFQLWTQCWFGVSFELLWMCRNQTLIGAGKHICQWHLQESPQNQMRKSPWEMQRTRLSSSIGDNVIAQIQESIIQMDERFTGSRKEKMCLEEKWYQRQVPDLGGSLSVQRLLLVSVHRWHTGPHRNIPGESSRHSISVVTFPLLAMVVELHVRCSHPSSLKSTFENNTACSHMWLVQWCSPNSDLGQMVWEHLTWSSEL